MNRRWQKDGRGRYETLPQSYGQFVASLPPLPSSMGLCDAADLYATFSMLHAKGRRADLRANLEQGFYYFMVAAAKQTSPATVQPAAVQPSPQIAQDAQHAPATAKALHASMDEPGAQPASADHTTTHTLEPSASEHAASLADPSTSTQTAAAASAFATSGLDQTGSDGKLLGLDLVVPVSSKSVDLSMDRVQVLFSLGPDIVAKQMLLAIVDDDGSVALIRMFNHIQPPEAPDDVTLSNKEDSD